jgi:hypothetical protein
MSNGYAEVFPPVMLAAENDDSVCGTELVDRTVCGEKITEQHHQKEIRDEGDPNRRR